MNSLKREIKRNEVVVLKAETMRPEFRDLENRLFVCLTGFGMSDITSGTAVHGKFLADAEEARFEGYEIDPEETREYQRTHVSNIDNVR